MINMEILILSPTTLNTISLKTGVSQEELELKLADANIKNEMVVYRITTSTEYFTTDKGTCLNPDCPERGRCAGGCAEK